MLGFWNQHIPYLGVLFWLLDTKRFSSSDTGVLPSWKGLMVTQFLLCPRWSPHALKSLGYKGNYSVNTGN